VPDLDVGALDRLARAGVHDGEGELEEQPLAVLADVAAREVVVDPIRALRDLGIEGARAGRRGLRCAERDAARLAEQHCAHTGQAKRRERLPAADERRVDL
jgi:hypothetical protein